MRHKVAVYGSLRKGFGNHGTMVRAEGTFLSKDTISGFNLYPYAGRSFPCVTKGDNNIVAEVYEVDEEGLSILDGLEGYPDFYDRLQTDTENHKNVWIYYHDRVSPELDLIESGDWEEFLNEKIY